MSVCETKPLWTANFLIIFLQMQALQCKLHTYMLNAFTCINSLASKFKLCVQLHSAKIRMLLRLPSCMLNNFTVWCFVWPWAVTLYRGSYKNIFMQASRSRFLPTWSLHWHDWKEDGKPWSVRKEIDNAVSLSSCCRLQTVCTFAQSTITVEVCVLKGGTVVK